MRLQETKAIAVEDPNDQFTISNGLLTIHNPDRRRNFGKYWCTAHNQFGTIKSEKVEITFICKYLLFNPSWICTVYAFVRVI